MKMDIKSLFGEEKLSFEEFTSKLKGVKLVDSSEYVSKEKYEAEKAAAKDWKIKHEELSKSVDGDEGFKTKLEQLEKDLENSNAKIEVYEKEKDTTEKLNILGTAKVGEKFRKFALNEINSLVDEKTDFNTALESWKKENTQFFESEETSKPFTFNQNTGVNKSAGADNDTKGQMNMILKQVL